MDLDLAYKVSSMLASRAFHDLAGPVSALTNGLSFLDESDDSNIVKMARKHLDESAVSLSARLEYFRLMLGRRSVAEIGWDKVHQIVHTYWERSENISLDWSSKQRPMRKLDSSEFLRAFMCALLACGDALSRGGTLSVQELSDRNLRVRVQGHGLVPDAASFTMLTQMPTLLEKVTPRLAPAAWVFLFAQAQGAAPDVYEQKTEPDVGTVMVALTR